MRKDKPSWIKPVHSTYAPGCIVSIMPETEHVDRQTGTGLNVSRLKRIHVYESHRRSVHWSSPEYRSFESGLQLMEWLESTRSKRRRTYIFVPDLMNSLALMSIFDVFEASGCMHEKGRDESRPKSTKQTSGESGPQTADTEKTHQSTCSDGLYHFTRFTPGVNAEIVSYHKDRSAYQWCGHSQYCQSAEHSVAKSINYHWHNLADYPADQPNAYRTPSDRASMWLSFYQRLADWWIDVDGGPWGATVASMSYSFLRRRLQPKSILHHVDEHAGQLEYQAIFGGRRSVWYVGNIGSEDCWNRYPQSMPARSQHGTIDDALVNHDIRSMYPYILSEMQFPVRHLENVQKPTNTQVLEMLQTYGVIAAVMLKTETPEYPKRTDAGIIYPVGVFSTTLCGPELMRALTAGDVIYVKSASVYVLGSPFAEPCGDLLQHRLSARKSKQDAWELFIKMLSNSMSGRIAMIPHEWAERKDMIPPEPWGLFRDKQQHETDWHVYKAHMGLVWEKIQSEQCNRPMGAAYAYLTSYGRWAMWAIRRICPAGTVIAQDTDGLWTTGLAEESLYHRYQCVNDLPGQLTCKHLSVAGRFYGSQHYWYGDGWVLSGSNVVTHRPCSDTILIREKLAAVRYASMTPSPLLTDRLVERQVGRILAPGEISATGWIEPIRLWTMPDIDRPDNQPL